MAASGHDFEPRVARPRRDEFATRKGKGEIDRTYVPMSPLADAVLKWLASRA